MHELSIAQALMDIVAEEAARHGLKRVVRVAVRVGALSAVVPEALKFSFDLVKEGTVAAEAELVIEEVPLWGRCQDCGAEGEMDGPLDQCQACGSSRMEILAGRELTIDYIETDEDQSQGG